MQPYTFMPTAGPSSDPFALQSQPRLSPLTISGLLLPSPLTSTLIHGPSPLSSVPPFMSASPASSIGMGFVLGQCRESPLDYGSPLPSKHARGTHSISRQNSLYPLKQTVAPVWDDNRQAHFCAWLAKITASCGFPFTWVKNIKWLDFCNDFLPEARNPSRRVLAHKLIPAEVD
ncbi:hypothetical protein BD413DRAFT_595481 [Trametes elegans]|nr:hypothetical protein BD413DRAFT_595481 [Trametes elegans]